METQAQIYSDIFDVLVKYSDSISAVVLWGVTDDQSWRAAKLPLLFDGQFQAKPAFYSVVDGLEEPVYAMGDTNMDSKISVNDIIALQKHLLLTKKLSASACKLADLNEDGVVNAFDLAFLKKQILAKS